MKCDICKTEDACIQATLNDSKIKNYCKDCYQSHLKYQLHQVHGKSDLTFCNKCGRVGNIILPLKTGVDSNDLFGVYCPDCLSMASMYVDYSMPEYAVYIDNDMDPDDIDDDGDGFGLEPPEKYF